LSLEDDTYQSMFTALKHPIRRRILRMLTQSQYTYTEMLNQLNIDNGLLNYHLDNMKELITALRERAAATLKGVWVSGVGYDDTILAENSHPTRYDLDKVSTDHPIFISHVSMHFLSLNSKALQMAGINKAS